MPDRVALPNAWKWLAVMAGALLLLWLLSPILLPFVAGMGVAYFLDPLADRLQRRGLSRGAATGLITFVFFGAVALAAILLVPIIVEQAVGFAGRAPGYLEELRRWLMPWAERALAMVDGGDREAATAALGKYGEKIIGMLGEIAGGLLRGGGALFGLVSLVVITPVVAFYLLRDWDLVIARVDSWLPRARAQTIRQLLRDMDAVIAGFVRGQATVCLVLAVYYGLSFSLIGLDFGLAIGIATGVFSFVPILGAGLGGLAAVAIALFQFWPDFPMIGAVAAVLGIGQFLEGQLLTPKLVGDKVGLHPAWVIFALLAGGALFGFVGLLLAVPTFAVIAVLARYFLGQYLQSSLYRGDGPPPPPSSSSGASP